MTTRVFIADDEALARAKLRRLIDAQPDFELVGESIDGRSAVDTITALKPDVIFLDVQMPELDGFEALHALPADVRPLIVFVTAYDQYALRAFDVHATDYLLKPFGAVRFQETVKHIREWLSARNGRQSYLERVSVPTSRGAIVLAINDVEWIEAAGNYVKLHYAGGHPLLRQSLAGLLEHVNPQQFARVHRGAVVNLACVQEVRSGTSGDGVVKMRSGARLKVSRSCRPALDRLIGRTRNRQTSGGTEAGG